MAPTCGDPPQHVEHDLQKQLREPAGPPQYRRPILRPVKKGQPDAAQPQAKEAPEEKKRRPFPFAGPKDVPGAFWLAMLLAFVTGAGFPHGRFFSRVWGRGALKDFTALFVIVVLVWLFYVATRARSTRFEQVRVSSLTAMIITTITAIVGAGINLFAGTGMIVLAVVAMEFDFLFLVIFFFVIPAYYYVVEGKREAFACGALLIFLAILAGSWVALDMLLPGY